MKVRANARTFFFKIALTIFCESAATPYYS